jgi:hypothetical protein
MCSSIMLLCINAYYAPVAPYQLNPYLGLYEIEVLTTLQGNGKLTISKFLNGAWWKK